MRITKMAPLFAATLLGAASPLAAQTITFNTTGNSADNGTYGDALTFSTITPSSLQVRVTGWQANQSTNAVTSAWVGAYSPGLGVTGVGDYNGSYNYHQIDNAGGYTDFVLLQFNAAVAITSLNLNSFLLGQGLAGYTPAAADNDFGIYALNLPETAWNSAIDLGANAAAVSPSKWTTVSGSGASGSVPTGVTLTSKEWLIGAAFNSGNNDGFKIASITVAVPEPASWATMILGMGLIGTALRRRTRATAPAAVA